MHYGDRKQNKSNILTIVVYKHGIMGRDVYKHGIMGWKPRYKKDGTLSRSSVDYDVTSIQKCQYFPPRILRNLLSDTYSHVNTKMSKLPFEKYYELELVTRIRDMQLLVHVLSVKDVTDSKNEFKRLH